MQIKFPLLILASSFAFFFTTTYFASCSECDCSKPAFAPDKKIDNRPIVNVYMECSGSMDGYVTNVTEFENFIYSYLNELSDCTDSLNLNYINSKIIPQKKEVNINTSIKSFIKNLNTSQFRNVGGNGYSTDIAEIIDRIVKNTDEKNVSLFISDCIFSPGQGVDAAKYLDAQEISLKKTFNDAIKQIPSMSVFAYRSLAQFNGTYFDRNNQRIKINDKRPFYIILFGTEENLLSITKKVKVTDIHGSIDGLFALNGSHENVNYSFVDKNKIGEYKRCKKNAKTHIVDASLAEKGSRKGEFAVTLGADFSKLLVDGDYLLDPNNYAVSNKSYEVSVCASEDSKYTHYLTLKLKPGARTVAHSSLTISLLKKIPSWVNKYNDPIGIGINDSIMNHTYGLQNLMNGIYNGMKNQDGKDDYYTKLLITIN